MAQAPPSAHPVLLGFKDALLEEGSSSWNVSKIGGLPDSFPHVKKLFPSCGLCSAALGLVAQIYCPLEGSLFDRVIHVFACCRNSCWGKSESWVALRSQSLEIQIKQCSLSQKENSTPLDWCEDADNWGVEDEESVDHILTTPEGLQTPVSTLFPTMDCTSKFEQLTLSDGLDSGQTGGPVFCSFYVAVAEEEEYLWQGDLDHAQRLLKEYVQREGNLPDESESCAGGKGETEKYEKLQSDDVFFYKFLKKIAPCREQILRYSWNGSPLYISPPNLHPTPCMLCGSRRVFEFQLMPALVSLLQDANADTLLEFGTVLVFTCEKSCWEADCRTPIQELCIVQEDPDQRHFK
ncbi:hypothetical protein GDO86_008388 [Hymenochirus boettgeri]|uniref:Programmed cell death protein 2 C-terminal domain-containing protein n=1 Tax=Hymenochirus boettgeri TaxID=247094 RepID=A0A8T2J070_9PIPI|nr:hypothetical protein GDO86_008388 [Hymenochirus boettgeri]